MKILYVTPVSISGGFGGAVYSRSLVAAFAGPLKSDIVDLFVLEESRFINNKALRIINALFRFFIHKTPLSVGFHTAFVSLTRIKKIFKIIK